MPMNRHVAAPEPANQRRRVRQTDTQNHTLHSSRSYLKIKEMSSNQHRQRVRGPYGPCTHSCTLSGGRNSVSGGVWESELFDRCFTDLTHVAIARAGATVLGHTLAPPHGRLGVGMHAAAYNPGQSSIHVASLPHRLVASRRSLLVPVRSAGQDAVCAGCAVVGGVCIFYLSVPRPGC